MTTLARWSVWVIFAATAVVSSARPAPAGDEKPLATVHLSAGWATFGQVLPAGAARSEVRVDTLATQSDVKTRWPDGSIRFAVVTAHVTASGPYSLFRAPAGVGSFDPRIPAVSVGFRIGGATWIAQAPTQVSIDRWLSGPLVMEWRDTVAPAGSTGDRHPSLRVIVDTRIYRDGQGRVDITVENVLNQRRATAVDYDVEITVNGRSVFARTGITHYYLTRWRKVFPVSLAASAVTPDFEPVFRARALPRYLSFVTQANYSTTGARFDLLGGGNFHNPMNDHGGRAEIAPYPDWVARYLVHARNASGPATKAYMLAMDEQAAAWPMHIRESDGTLVSIDVKPNFWLDPRCDRSDRVNNCVQGNLTATGPLGPEGNAHQPSIGYVSYLVTGDRFFMDEMKFWANYSLLWTHQSAHYNSRGGGMLEGPGSNTPIHPGSRGLLRPNEVRGMGWGLRVLVDAAAFVPDSDPLKAYFAQKVLNNLDWFDDEADYEARNFALGQPFPGWRRKTQYAGGQAWVALWEAQYLAWAIDHSNKQGFAGGGKLRDRIARWTIKLNSSAPDYPLGYGTPYELAVGVFSANPTVPPYPIQGYTSMKQVFDATFGIPPRAPDAGPAGHQGPPAYLMALIGLEQGFPRARQLFDYLWRELAVEGHAVGLDGRTRVPDLANRAGWAISADPAPSPRTSSTGRPK